MGNRSRELQELKLNEIIAIFCRSTLLRIWRYKLQVGQRKTRKSTIALNMGTILTRNV